MGEQGVKEGAEHASLWGPSDEDLRSGRVVSYLLHLGAAPQEVQDPVAQGGVQTQGLELNDELGGYYGVECLDIVSEQHSYTCIPLVQMG